TSSLPTVIVAKPKKLTLVDMDEYTGRFVPIDTVEIHARASGYLDRVVFTDGQMVKQGDLLFTMDKRSSQIALEQSPYACVLPDHKPGRCGRETIDPLAAEEPTPGPAKIRAGSYEAAVDQLFKRMRSSSSALTQQSGQYSQGPGTQRKTSPSTATWQTDGND